MLRQWQRQLCFVAAVLAQTHAAEDAILFSSTSDSPNFTQSETTLSAGATTATSAGFAWMDYLYYIIGGAGLCLCCVCIAVAIYVRTRHRVESGNRKLAQIQDEINERKKCENLEEQPIAVGSTSRTMSGMTGAPPTSAPISPATAPWSPTAMNRAYGFEGNAAEQLQLDDIDRLQQAQRQFRGSSFRKPEHIAAFQALQFAPPINHDGRDGKWKNLDHRDPNKRMMQLMQQQKYAQQLANQAAVAMNYFLEQQSRIQEQIIMSSPPTNPQPSPLASPQQEPFPPKSDVHAAPARGGRTAGPPPPRMKPPMPPPGSAPNDAQQGPGKQRLDSVDDDLIAHTLPFSVVKKSCVDGQDQFSDPSSRFKKNESIEASALPDLPFLSNDNDNNRNSNAADGTLAEYDEDEYEYEYEE